MCTYLLNIVFIFDSVHKYKNKEKDPTPSSTLYRNSLSTSTASQNRKQECTEPKRSKDDSESSKPLFNKSKACKKY